MIDFDTVNFDEALRGSCGNGGGRWVDGCDCSAAAGCATTLETALAIVIETTRKDTD